MGLANCRWIYRLNHVDLAVNSVRRLLLARSLGHGRFDAMEDLGDEIEVKGNPAGYTGTAYVPLNIPFGTRCIARVRFTIDGQISDQEYRFVLDLGKDPSCCREEDDLPF